MDFYNNLFGEKQCSMECRKELLEGLPHLSQGKKAVLDWDLTLEELMVAVNQLALGRAPGIDGSSSGISLKLICTVFYYSVSEQDLFLSPVSMLSFPCY